MMYLNDMECKMYLFETIFVKGNFIYFNEQSLCTFKSLIYPKFIIVIEIDTSKAGASKSLEPLSLLRRSVWSVRTILLPLQENLAGIVLEVP